MRRHPFLTLALAAALATLAACNENSCPEPSWTFPAEEVGGEALDLRLNGAACSAGTARLEAVDDTSARLCLTGIVTGYPDVAIPVGVTAVHPDGSFEFAGETGLAAPGAEGRAEADAPLFTLAVTGSATPGGRLAARIVTTLAASARGPLTGTWRLSTDLVYIDENQEAVTLPTTPVQLDWQALDATKTNGEQLALIGRRLLSQVLSEVLSDLTFDERGTLTATYYPDLMTDVAYDEEKKEFYDVESYLAGNGMAEYYDRTTWWMMSKLLMERDIHVYPRKWSVSPANLASWYVADGELRLLLNLPQIVAADDDAALDAEQLLTLLHTIGTASDEELSQLMEVVGRLVDPEGELGLDFASISPELLRRAAGYLETGIPFKYSLEEGVLKLYADRQMAAPFMEALLGFMPAIDALLEREAAANPLLGMLTGMLGVERFADLQTVWRDNTADFAAGLCLKR